MLLTMPVVCQRLTIRNKMLLYKSRAKEANMKQAKDISYKIDDNGTMTIYVNGCSVADISECKKLDDIQTEALVTEVLADLGYEV